MLYLDNIFTGLIDILRDVRNIVDSADTDVIWSGYNSVEELINDLDIYIGKLNTEDSTVINDIEILFAPTGSLQEISISNGWSDKFLQFSVIIDNLILCINEQ